MLWSVLYHSLFNMFEFGLLFGQNKSFENVTLGLIFQY